VIISCKIRRFIGVALDPLFKESLKYQNSETESILKSNNINSMTEKTNFNASIKKLETVKKQFEYTAYQQQMLDKFKSALRDDELESLQNDIKKNFCQQKSISDFFVDYWLIEKGIIPIDSFEDWQKGKGLR